MTKSPLPEGAGTGVAGSAGERAVIETLSRRFRVPLLRFFESVLGATQKSRTWFRRSSYAWPTAGESSRLSGSKRTFSPRPPIYCAIVSGDFQRELRRRTNRTTRRCTAALGRRTVQSAPCSEHKRSSSSSRLSTSYPSAPAQSGSSITFRTCHTPRSLIN